MANYEAYARSNYFRVTDDERFVALCKRWAIEHITKDVDGEKLHGFLCENGLPDNELYDEETEGNVEANFHDELAETLVEGSVAVMQEVGFEKLRYLVGFARALNSKGEVVEVSIDNIFDLAKTLGSQITDCSG